MGDSTFSDAPFSVTNAGVLKSTSGTIGEWTIGTDKFSAGTDADYIALIPGTGIQMGDSTFSDAPFSVTKAGVLKATSGTIGGWTIDDDEIKKYTSNGGLALYSGGSEGKLIGYRDAGATAAVQIGIGTLDTPAEASSSSNIFDVSSGMIDDTDTNETIQQGHTTYTRVSDTTPSAEQYSYYFKEIAAAVGSTVAWWQTKNNNQPYEWLSPKFGSRVLTNHYALQYRTEADGLDDVTFTASTYKSTGNNNLNVELSNENYSGKIVKVGFWYYIPNEEWDYINATLGDNKNESNLGLVSKNLTLDLIIDGVSTTTTKNIVTFAKNSTAPLSIDIQKTLATNGGVWVYYNTSVEAKSTSASPLAYFKWTWDHQVTDEPDMRGTQYDIYIPRVVVDGLTIRAVEKPSTQIYETGLIAYQETDEKIVFDESGLNIVSAQGTISAANLKTPSLLLDNASGSNPTISTSTSYISGSTISIIGQSPLARGDEGIGNPAGDLVLRTSTGGAALGSNFDGGTAGNIYQYLGAPGTPVGTGVSGSYGKVFMGYSIDDYTTPDNLLNIRHISSSIGLQFGRVNDETNATANEIIGKIDFIDGDGTVKNSIKAYGSTGDISIDGDISGSNIVPNTSNTYDLGSTGLRWKNLYTTDLQLSNMDREEGNIVDGTKGNWTLQEGESDLFVINNITGKKYKIALIPTEDI